MALDYFDYFGITIRSKFNAYLLTGVELYF